MNMEIEEIRALHIFISDYNVKKGEILICDKYSYPWISKSMLSYVSCPNCEKKVKRETMTEIRKWVNQHTRRIKKENIQPGLNKMEKNDKET